MPRIVLGTANFNQFYGLRNKKFSKSEIRKVMPAFLNKSKINHIDTALDYNISADLINSLKIKNLRVTTKVKLPKDKKNIFLKTLKKRLKTQLKNLRIKNYEAILIHDLRDLKTENGKKLLKILEDFKKEKKTKMIGASLYSPNEIIKTFQIMKMDIVQFPLNIFNSNFVTKKWINFFKKKQIKIQIRSIFLQGLLLVNKEHLDELKINKYLRNHLIRFNKWIKKNKMSSVLVSINFIKKYYPVIDYIIIGSDNYPQFLQNIKLLKSKKTNFKLKKFSSINEKIIDPRKWN